MSQPTDDIDSTSAGAYAREGNFDASQVPPADMATIEAWIKEGRDDIEGHYKKQFKRNPEDPVYKFVQAYLKSRTLSQLESKKAHGQAVKEALALLGPATKAFPRSAEVQHLWGTLLHQQYLRQGEKKAALNALPHYLLAQDF